MKNAKARRDNAVLIVIDFQERLLPAIKNGDEICATAAKLIKGANILGVPVLVTEQYPKGLGPTVPAIAEALGDAQPIVKTTFSVMDEPFFAEVFNELGKQDVIICGIEAHVCVEQTALDLVGEEYNVFIVEDAIGSRSNNDKKYAGRRMVEAGCIGTTYEAVLFEMLGGAEAHGFKEISKLVK